MEESLTLTEKPSVVSLI